MSKYLPVTVELLWEPKIEWRFFMHSVLAISPGELFLSDCRLLLLQQPHNPVMLARAKEMDLDCSLLFKLGQILMAIA